MPRQSRSRPTTSRPSVASHSAPSRGAATAAYPSHAQAPPAPAPPAHAQAPPQAAQSSGPGMLAQMAATAGSVAVGSTIGHGISSMLFGSGGSSQPVEQPQQAQAPIQQNQMSQTSGVNCEIQAKEFTKCLEKADLPSCTWYLDQLKACQAAAAPY
ncbi:hypothetical protein DENSPDRAFT_838866 [Dentipellis sp. KUC8613]|nr:hypothetical protein DENSPDRAFT_838866 [Dentipellis sp. KUC8613]